MVEALCNIASYFSGFNGRFLPHILLMLFLSAGWLLCLSGLFQVTLFIIALKASTKQPLVIIDDENGIVFYFYSHNEIYFK
ncbi:MAG: hypothetical protein JKX75_03845 [Gammaproteobacteria bacterium]|nr:hypothetical protein [Gammaproteobacteria bacterium]